MKHIQIVIFFIFLPFISISQNKLYKITYLNIADIDAQVRSTDILYFNEKIAYYEIGKSEIIHKKSYDIDAVIIQHDRSITSFVYTDFTNNKQYNTFERLNIYRTVETLPVMNWILTDETKEIEGILLHKANVSFRGRNYEAWCNLNIPISTGPWKFNGAPGLIYEIKSLEDDYSYYWSLKEFKEVTEDKKLKETLLLLARKLDKDYTDLKINVKKIDEEILSKQFVSDTRLPEGLFIEYEENEQVDLKEMRKKDIEIKYEWEN